MKIEPEDFVISLGLEKIRQKYDGSNSHDERKQLLQETFNDYIPKWKPGATGLIIDKDENGTFVYSDKIHDTFTLWLDKSFNANFFTFIFWLQYISHPKINEHVSEGTSFVRQKSPGFVYLAVSSTGHYKIGISKNPVHRVTAIDTGSPIDVKLIHYFPADDMSPPEKELHTRFNDKKHKGEWFFLDENDIEYITNISRFSSGQFYTED